MSAIDDLRNGMMSDLLEKNKAKEPVTPADVDVTKNTNSAELASAVKGSGNLLEQVLQNKAEGDKPDEVLEETRKRVDEMVDENLSLIGKLI